jgi:hypothetical protein
MFVVVNEDPEFVNQVISYMELFLHVSWAKVDEEHTFAVGFTNPADRFLRYTIAFGSSYAQVNPKTINYLFEDGTAEELEILHSLQFYSDPGCFSKAVFEHETSMMKRLFALEKVKIPNIGVAINDRFYHLNKLGGLALSYLSNGIEVDGWTFKHPHGCCSLNKYTEQDGNDVDAEVIGATFTKDNQTLYQKLGRYDIVSTTLRTKLKDGRTKTETVEYPENAAHIKRYKEYQRYVNGQWNHRPNLMNVWYYEYPPPKKMTKQDHKQIEWEYEQRREAEEQKYYFELCLEEEEEKDKTIDYKSVKQKARETKMKKKLKVKRSFERKAMLEEKIRYNRKHDRIPSY